MRVFLLPRRDGASFLYSPDLRRPEPPGVPRSGATGSRLVAGVGATYRWLTGARRRREALLEALGERERLRIFYASSQTESHARAVLDGLLHAEVRRHRKWMWVNAAALPISVPLGLIPGPNLILGYLAFRSVSHYRSKKSGQRAARLEVVLEPEPALAELEGVLRESAGRASGDRIREIGERIGIERLDELY